MMKISEQSEFGYIEWIRDQIPGDPRVILGPGDDTAIIKPTKHPTLITTDMLLEGSCFILEEAGPYRVGRKAMAVNISDIAAMAGIPVCAVVSVGLPRQRGREIGEELFRGIRDVAKEFNVALVGGDTNSWNGPLTISVTLIGESTDRGEVRRSGAKIGDWIMVTGSFGGSILGHHLDFAPRVREAIAIHQVAAIRSMIDVSDGLTQDLHHICEESRCGALLDANSIPIAPAASVLSGKDGKTPLEHALGDGEDFELIFTVSPEDGSRLLLENPLEGVAITKIGEIIEDGFYIVRDGVRERLQPKGYQHQI